MAVWKTEWTGSYPCLCMGEWVLYKDGQELDIEIPFQGGDANTYGEYQEWHFEDWMEVFESYEDGLTAEDWWKNYSNWLKTFAPENEWKDVYYAFAANDFRTSSCGGCI